MLHRIGALPLVGSGGFVDGGLRWPPLHNFAPEISGVVSVGVTTVRWLRHQCFHDGQPWSAVARLYIS